MRGAAARSKGYCQRPLPSTMRVAHTGPFAAPSGPYVTEMDWVFLRHARGETDQGRALIDGVLEKVLVDQTLHPAVHMDARRAHALRRHGLELHHGSYEASKRWFLECCRLGFDGITSCIIAIHGQMIAAKEAGAAADLHRTL